MTFEPRTLGPWTLHDELGSGGNATVYKATSPDFSDPVAVKVGSTHGHAAAHIARPNGAGHRARNVGRCLGSSGILNAAERLRPS